MENRKNSVKILLLIVLFVQSCTIETKVEAEEISSAYFGLEASETPRLIAPGFISMNLNEYNATFSPNGKEFYYTSETAGKGHITMSKMDENGNWSQPEIASFSGKFSEYDPLMSPDGRRLYFSSERPLPDSTEEQGTHIWYLDRTEKGWGKPNYLALTGNGDYHSSLTRHGNIYFNVWNTGKLMLARKSVEGYVIEELPDVFNQGDAGDAFISPDEDYLLFRAYRNEGLGGGDLYISFNIEGAWTNPENLGNKINSNRREMCPIVSPDGKLFMFASNRLMEDYPNGNLKEIQEKHHSYDNANMNLYFMSADFIDEMKKKHLSK